MNNRNQLRENNPNWKGGRIIDNGYVRVYVGDGKYVSEHKLVMENILGRKLKRYEMVHHIDESYEARSNNDSSNLQLTTRSKHITHHKKGKGKGYYTSFDKYRSEYLLYVRGVDGIWRYKGRHKTKEQALKIAERLKLENKRGE
jgi:hypothetical protein